MQRGNVRDRAERHEVEQAHQVRLVAAVEISLGSQRPDQRNAEQERNAYCCQVAVACREVAFVEAVGVDQRRRRRKLGGAFVVIDDDHIDACIARHRQCFMRHCPAIDRDDQARTSFGQFDQRLSARPVTFEQAVGDVEFRLKPQTAEQFDHKRRTCRAIDVVVAVNRDLFLSQHRLRDTLGRLVHVAEFRRVGQKFAHGRPRVPRHIVFGDTAGHEQLRKDIAFQTLRAKAFAKVHIPSAPQPRAAGKRIRYAENVRK